jgi:hypothetical protein
VEQIHATNQKTESHDSVLLKGGWGPKMFLGKSYIITVLNKRTPINEKKFQSVQRVL